jgi:hypothetical protein
MIRQVDFGDLVTGSQRAEEYPGPARRVPNTILSFSSCDRSVVREGGAGGDEIEGVGGLDRMEEEEARHGALVISE